MANKVIDHVDDICERFIAASPFVLVASRGVDGRLNTLPRGAPGFVTVLDRRTLAISDRLGNQKFFIVQNLFAHPEVALLFLIPGNGDTLRVSGKGSVVRDRGSPGAIDGERQDARDDIHREGRGSIHALPQVRRQVQAVEARCLAWIEAMFRPWPKRW